jgi:hypothetical protein
MMSGSDGDLGRLAQRQKAALADGIATGTIFAEFAASA